MREADRARDARRDHAHKVARKIVDAAGIIGLEALGVRNMTRRAKGTAQAPGRRVRAQAGLNRRILDAGFGLLRQMILAKAEEAARRVVAHTQTMKPRERFAGGSSCDSYES